MGEASVAYDDPEPRLAGPTYIPILDPFFFNFGDMGRERPKISAQLSKIGSNIK